jgi:hypothetical protein
MSESVLVWDGLAPARSRRTECRDRSDNCTKIFRFGGERLRDGGGDGIKLTGVVGFHIDSVKVIGRGGNWTAVNFIGSRDGLVERSYLENTTPGSGTGVQAKSGSADIVIRANRFVNANERSIQIGGGGAAELFRPQPPGNVHAARKNRAKRTSTRETAAQKRFAGGR